MLVVGCSHSVVSTDDVTTTKVNGRYSVTLSIIQGRKIKKMDISGESDPYVKVTFAGQSKRTSVRPSTATPVWNERLLFRGTASQDELPSYAMLEVYDRDVIGKDDFIGQYRLDLAPLWAAATVSGNTVAPRSSEEIGSNETDTKRDDASSDQAEPVTSSGNTFAGWLTLKPQGETSDQAAGSSSSSASTQQDMLGEIQLVVQCQYSTIGEIPQTLAFDATGLLVVNVIKARNLPVVDTLGSCDPQFTLAWGDERYQSPVVKNSLHPVWNIQTSFWVNSNTQENYQLQLILSDSNLISKNQYIGAVYLNASSILELTRHGSKSNTTSDAIPNPSSITLDGEEEKKAEAGVEQKTVTSTSSSNANSDDNNPEEKESPVMRGWVSLSPQQAVKDRCLSSLLGANLRDEKSDYDATLSPLGEVLLEIQVFPEPYVEKRLFAHLAERFDVDSDGLFSLIEVTELLRALSIDVDPSLIESLYSSFTAENKTNSDHKNSNSSSNVSNGDGSKGSITASDLTKLLRTVALLDADAGQQFIDQMKVMWMRPPPEFLMQGVTHNKTSKNILLKDRKTGLVVSENIPTYISASLKVLFGTRLSRKLASGSVSTNLMTKLSIKQGEKFNKPESVDQIPAFIELHNLNVNEVEKPLDQYATFNEFFARGLKPEARPIASHNDPTIAVSAADCRLTVFPLITDATQLWIKGDKFTIEGVLGSQGKAEAGLYTQGSMCIFRLAPQDYHRWHFPVSGKLIRSYSIDGHLYTVNPLAINKNVNVYTENKREVYFIESPEFGKVCLVAVGATCVGSITTLVSPPANVSKGQQHGYFSFGGSTVLAFFPPDSIKFDKDLVTTTSSKMETLVQVNSQLGQAVKPGQWGYGTPTVSLVVSDASSSSPLNEGKSTTTGEHITTAETKYESKTEKADESKNKSEVETTEIVVATTDDRNVPSVPIAPSTSAVGQITDPSDNPENTATTGASTANTDSAHTPEIESSASSSSSSSAPSSPTTPENPCANPEGI